MPNFEKFDPIEEQENREKNGEKLRNYLELISDDLNSEGIPVTPECRIDTKAFTEIYGANEIKEDGEEVARLKVSYAKNEGLSVEKWENKKIKKDGEQLEMLKTAIFHKNLGPDFIVVRASEYDDIKSKVDNVIINKKTGSVICAFDEGSPREGREYEEKQDKILDRDKSGGANLKYGLTFKDGQDKPQLGTLDKLPIFLLALDPSEIQKGMEKFDEDDEYEKKLFRMFITEIDIQIKKLEEISSNIPHQLQAQWNDFREFVKDKL